MCLWDTHCHLFSEYYDLVDDIVISAKRYGVTHLIVSGCDEPGNQEVINQINRENTYGVIGFHPEVASKKNLNFESLEENLKNPKIIGIGEIGLDYHYTKENKEEQKILFESQLRLAEQNNLPVVIHSRDATQDTIDILKKYSVKGVIHSFSGSLEVAKIYISMGFKLGINGVITFKNSKLKEIISDIFPYIVLETDSPYLTPHPFRGSRNEPKYIRNIAEFIAEELDISVSQVEKVTNENVLAIFDKIQ